jgi:hypothetical protein
MSNEFNELVSAALDEALAFMGEVVIIGSEKVSAIVNQVSFDEEFMDTGGLLHNRGITTVIATPSTLPAVGSTIIYGGFRYRILEVRTDSAGVELVCATDSK